MKSNYDLLGNHIRLIDNRNKDLVTEEVLGTHSNMPAVVLQQAYFVSCWCTAI